MGVTGKGIYCYDLKNKEIKNFTVKTGLMSSETWYGFKEDKKGNLFAACPYGFCIISPDRHD